MSRASTRSEAHTTHTNNNNNNTFYLYSAFQGTQSRFTESSIHSDPVIPVVQKRGCPISAYGPSDHHQHSFNIHTLHVFMMVGETGVPGGNPRRHGENM